MTEKYLGNAKKIYFLGLWRQIKEKLRSIQENINLSLQNSNVKDQTILIGMISIKNIIEGYKPPPSFL